MTHEESKKLLNDYFDEQLSSEVNNEIQVHLSECEECSQYLFSLQDLMKNTEMLPRNLTPPIDFWPDIFSSISSIKEVSIKQKEELDLKEAEQTAKETFIDKQKQEERIKAEKLLKWEIRKDLIIRKLKTPAFRKTLIAAVSVIILFLIYKIFIAPGSAWDVRKLRVGADEYEPFNKIKDNEILESDSFTNYEVRIPEVGSVYLEPHSKIERIGSDKIRFLQGIISKSKGDAKILFNVELPGAEIKDYTLGGNYKITMLDSTTTTLFVNDGWINVKRGKLETLVLPRHICKVTANYGIGLPYNSSASKEFINLIDDYSFRKQGDEEILVSILTNADISNTVTLWNLLNRVTRKQRDMVIYTILGLIGDPPEGVTIDGLKTLDPEMLRKLLNDIATRV